MARQGYGVIPEAGLPSPWSESDAAGRHALRAEILAQVSNEALQGETLEDVLQAIVDCLARRLPVTIASIILLDEARTHFVQEVWAGELLLQAPGEMPWPVGVGAAGRCVRAGQPQLIENVADDPDYVAGHPDVRSEYLVPIRHRGVLHGVLNLESTRRDFFSPEVCAMFDAVAAQIAGAVHLARVVQQLERANRQLEQLSMQDGLTGIANRRGFDLRLESEWERHLREGMPLGLVLADVDDFKALNDACGHLYGDDCLRELARVFLAKLKGRGAFAARYGGEEFLVLAPEHDLRKARSLGEQLRCCVEALAIAHPRSRVAPHVTVSIGVSALTPDVGHRTSELLAAADRAMYEAKAKGRNRVVARAVRSAHRGPA